MSAIGEIFQSFQKKYSETPPLLKIIDQFLVFALLTAAVQFGYMLLVGTFPFNAFLAGFFCSLGFLTLTVCLRMQVDPTNKDFNISKERAFADYIFANLVLYLVVWNYMG